MGFFDRLKQGLKKTSSAITEQVNSVFSVFVKVDEELFENLEEALIMADLGMDTSVELIEELRERVKKKHIMTVTRSKGNCRLLLQMRFAKMIQK